MRLNMRWKAACGMMAALMPWLATAAGMSTPGQFAVGAGGAATYSIPIQVPPGTAGIEPKLAFTYSSQSGNGQLGLGWSLGGLSAIARCPQSIAQDGVWHGVNYDANDRYCLDGQRLIAVNGAYGANGTEYRTEQESFSKIVSYGVAGNGPASFKVWTRAGQIIEYGNSVDARVEAQGKTTVRAWAMNKFQDTKGNYFTVTYTEDAQNGNYYPSRIDYTGNAVAGTVPNNSVQFSYESKPDTGSIYIGGSLIKNTVRLTKVQTYSASTLVGEYRIGYGSATATSQIATITQCDGNNTCLPPTTFGWQAGTGSNGIGSTTSWGTLSSYPKWNMATGDANGDGFNDLLGVDPVTGDIWISYSTGASFGNWIGVGQVPKGPGGFPYRATLADVNGDGRADIVAGDGTVWLSNGNGFSAPQKLGKGPDTNFWLLSAGDANGDGYADIMWFSPASGAVYVSYSSGNALADPVYIGQTSVAGANWGNTHVPVGFGDVNGDGLADIVAGDGTVWISTGTGFLAPQNWAPSTTVSLWFVGTGDVNGDGYADLMMVDGNNNLYVAYSSGISFGSGWTNLGAAPSAQDAGNDPLVFGDVNGDGRMDVIAWSGKVRLATTPTPDLIVNITSGLGAVTTITYKPLTDASVYTPDTGSVYPVRDVKQQGPIYVVSQVQTSNGIGGVTTTNYSYGGLKADLTGRGSLGFRLLQVTQADTGLVTKTLYRQDWPYVGLPTVVTKSLPGSGNGGLLKQVNNSFGCTDFVNTSGCTVAIGRRYFPFSSQSTESSWDLNGTALPTVTTTTQYDAWGNATQVTVGTGDGYGKTTTNTYTNDTANWFLGRLTSSSVTSTMP